MSLPVAPTSEYQQFLTEMYRTIPAVTANYVIDSEGNVYPYSVDADASALPEELRSYLELYQELQYNHLFDDSGRQDSLFLIGGFDSLSSLR